MKIDLLIVATAKYIKYLPELLFSVKKYFMVDMEVVVHVFTDRIEDCDLLLSQTETNELFYHRVEHKPWPHATLKRFHFFNTYRDHIKGDYVFYIDADTIITAPVTSSILSPRIAVLHCGFINGGGSWETRPASKCYMLPEKRKKYYGGGFWGFGSNNFKYVVEQAIEMIDKDEENGIVPVFHDESVINKIFSEVEPTLTLSPSYHWPQSNPRIWNSWHEKYECIILLLNKNHNEMRS